VVFFEEHARLLLLLHTVLAVAAVAASTHLVLWLRKVRKGQHGKLAAARRFALYAALLHLGAFIAGNLMYPTYKVRVKVEFLQNPPAVLEEADARAARAAEAERRFHDPEALPPSEGQLARANAGRPGTAEKLSRWFDSKEHWVAMGLPLAIALAFLLPAWRPEPGEGAEVGTIVFLLALAACFTLWFGAVVGVLVTSFRAVG
jgi:hypothetical protein